MDASTFEKQLRKEIDEYLTILPLMTIKPAEVQKRLEDKFHLDLAEVKDVIDDQVGKFVILKIRARTKSDKGNEGIPSKSCKVPLSLALSYFLGTGETDMLRSDAMEKIWCYVKSNKLDDGPVVTCDEKLRLLFGVDSFMAHDICRLLEGHFLKTEYQVYYETRS